MIDSDAAYSEVGNLLWRQFSHKMTDMQEARKLFNRGTQAEDNTLFSL